MDEKNSAKKDLCLYRLERAKACLEEAKTLLEANCFDGSVTRSYYAIFNVMRAVLALDEIDFKHHSGVISYFRKEYIKTGMIEKTVSDYIGEAFTVRNDSDYEDFSVVEKDDAARQINNASYCVKVIEVYLMQKNL